MQSPRQFGRIAWFSDLMRMYKCIWCKRNLDWRRVTFILSLSLPLSVIQRFLRNRWLIMYTCATRHLECFSENARAFIWHHFLLHTQLHSIFFPNVSNSFPNFRLDELWYPEWHVHVYAQSAAILSRCNSLLFSSPLSSRSYRARLCFSSVSASSRESLTRTSASLLNVKFVGGLFSLCLSVPSR